MNTRTLILGIGNRLRGNDGIGLRVVDMLITQKKWSDDIVIDHTHTSGISLLSYFINYERVFVIDSVQVHNKEIGIFWKMRPHELPHFNFPLRLTHGLGVHTVLDIGKKIGFKNPRDVILFLIGIKQMNDISIQCSEKIDEPLLKIIPTVCNSITQELEINGI
ncbi:MAG: hydrogenase maturation protease [Candidatus Omnitrophica bacterium]|nr:hydrogenase maturation protease [Candidatus Omnitrophota bacterium]